MSDQLKVPFGAALLAGKAAQLYGPMVPPQKVEGGGSVGAHATGTNFGGGMEAAVGPSFRAVDNLPKGEFVQYTENISPQMGYGAGISTRTLWC